MQPYGHNPPQQGQWAPPPAPPNTNGTAIAALVFSLLLPPVGIVLGYVARSQIRQSGEGGAGLAKAALVIGWIFVVVPVVVLLLSVVGTGVFIWLSAPAGLTPPPAPTPAGY